MTARKRRRGTGPAPGGPRETGEKEAAKPEAAAAEIDRARRYLDLWERNLSHLALHGPAPGPARRP